MATNNPHDKSADAVTPGHCPGVPRHLDPLGNGSRAPNRHAGLLNCQRRLLAQIAPFRRPRFRWSAAGSPVLANASPAVYKVCVTERAMQEATFLILTALADGSQHGYGIIAEVQEISGGRVRLRAGTLYTALDRLRVDGLIGVDREEIVEGRLRRYYRLTPEGTERLAAEAARLQANARAALARLKPLGVVT